MMTVLIVLPILTILMFELGLNNLKDFALLYKRPLPMIIGQTDSLSYYQL